MIYIENYKMPIRIEKRDDVGDEIYWDYKRLANGVGEWCIEIEIFYDLIQRSILYELHENKELEVDELKKELEPKIKFEFKGFTKWIFRKIIYYVFLNLNKKVADFGMQSIKNNI